MTQSLLTGIKPTGRPHLGNYVGAIRPALSRIERSSSSYYFVADYHALTSIHDPALLNELIYDVAATWLSLGLNPDKTVLYRQSKIPQITELGWILSCFTPKGLMNRAHAYKAVVASNSSIGDPDLDKGVNMGLYTYPILMAADILLANIDLVPVGKDQVQHVEIARDIAQRFNSTYASDTFKLPAYILEDEGQVVPGLDGRKMSKSYGNTIPLFSDGNELRKLIMKIKTDSKAVHEEKDPDCCSLYQLAKHFLEPSELEELRNRYRLGIGYGEIKGILSDAIVSKLKEPREKYLAYMADKQTLIDVLESGENTMRNIAARKLEEVKQQIGVSGRRGVR